MLMKLVDNSVPKQHLRLDFTSKPLWCALDYQVWMACWEHSEVLNDFEEEATQSGNCRSSLQCKFVHKKVCVSSQSSFQPFSCCKISGEQSALPTCLRPLDQRLFQHKRKFPCLNMTRVQVLDGWILSRLIHLMMNIPHHSELDKRTIIVYCKEVNI